MVTQTETAVRLVETRINRNYLFTDLDANRAYHAREGLHNVTVWLCEDLGCDTQKHSLLATLETANQGEYYFTDLEKGPPGLTGAVCYVVLVDANYEDLGACNVPARALRLATLSNAAAPDTNTGDFAFRQRAGFPGGHQSF